MPFVCGFLLTTLLTACGDGKQSVHGTVTLDGQPVKVGSITFMSTEGPLIREGGVITNGAFTTRVPPGKYKVILKAQYVVGTRKQTGFDGKEEELPQTDELFPERYNAKTELIETIGSGDNNIKLDLKSK